MRMKLLEDPRTPVVIAALLGLVAGVTAKQAVTIATGRIPKRVELVADVLILGMILIIVMYVYSLDPKMPPEAVALLSSTLAMWGPKGIAALVARIRQGMLGSAEAIGRSFLEPAHRPTIIEEGVVMNNDPNHGGRRQGELTQRPELMQKAHEEGVPIAKLRDVIPLEETPPDMLGVIQAAMGAEMKSDAEPPQG
jgi:hypothetical protein